MQIQAHENYFLTGEGGQNCEGHIVEDVPLNPARKSGGVLS